MISETFIRKFVRIFMYEEVFVEKFTCALNMSRKTFEIMNPSILSWIPITVKASRAPVSRNVNSRIRAICQVGLQRLQFPFPPKNPF